ncbi:CDP-alcohol phosphatidyltransferase family protein [Kribbella sp. NPDC049227]|uniref:CDP-alcohol phosphatidyltransferase family protein n=1 Tax=Kribbella sp. NPDC049227 TaxID=3364113 RepID=UPI003723F385
MATAELVVLRPVAVGAAATAFGCMIAAAPVPAGAAFAGYVAAALVVMVGWMRNRPGHHAFGVANALTLARLVGSVWILALLLQAVWAEPTRLIAICIAVVGTICLILDGVDGRIARRLGETSSFGGCFDNETDAGTTLLLSAALGVLHVAGWWVVLIGLLRYLYLLAAVVVPALRAPLPFSQVRRAIGLGQAIILVLCVLLAGVTSSSWLALLPAIALLSLFWSFGRDARGQLVSARR